MCLKQGDGHKIFLERERESNYNLLVYGASKSAGIIYDKKHQKLDNSDGRTAFYITVGQMKHTNITIKTDPNNKVMPTQFFEGSLSQFLFNTQFITIFSSVFGFCSLLELRVGCLPFLNRKRQN